MQRNPHWDAQTVQSQRQGEFWKQQQQKATWHVGENPYRTISGFFIINLADQKGVEWYIRSVERKKKMPTKNSVLSKTVHHEGEVDFPRQTKAQGVHHH